MTANTRPLSQSAPIQYVVAVGILILLLFGTWLWPLVTATAHATIGLTISLFLLVVAYGRRQGFLKRRTPVGSGFGVLGGVFFLAATLVNAQFTALCLLAGAILFFVGAAWAAIQFLRFRELQSLLEFFACEALLLWNMSFIVRL